MPKFLEVVVTSAYGGFIVENGRNVAAVVCPTVDDALAEVRKQLEWLRTNMKPLKP